MPRCDLQVHSRYSDSPSEWVLRKLGIPRSYTQPLELYRKLKEKGFDFVTMTDHNRIEGCREIAQLPGVFFSVEVTTYFPEDGCKIHLLVWNLTEAQYEEIERIRTDIYRLAAWLNQQGIAHGVAHPLFNLNGKLSPDLFEKLILLFRVFEVMNGSGSRLAQEIALGMAAADLGQSAVLHHVAGGAELLPQFLRQASGELHGGPLGGLEER